MTIEQILFQAGAVGAFIIFALVWRRLDSNEREARDILFQNSIKDITAAFTKALADRDAAMTEALSLDRAQRKEGMDHGEASLASLTDAVAGLTDAISRHEALAEKRHQRTMDAVRAIPGRRRAA